MNVQGLTDVKMVEMVEMLKEGDGRKEAKLIGLVETHEKYIGRCSGRMMLWLWSKCERKMIRKGEDLCL